MSTKNRLAAAAAAIAVGAAVYSVAWPLPAIATQGQPVIAGQPNSATSATTINTSGMDHGLVVAGHGNGFAGVSAFDTETNGTGVQGEGGPGGTGVFGSNPFGTGIGVWGRTAGSGSGVYGQATGAGVGVFGDTVDGTGLTGRSTHGTALRVLGKATFSRSGTVVIPAGSAIRTVTLSGVTTASMILVTAQQNAAVFAKSAVPASGRFTIRLSGNAPTGGLKVAYFVLN